MKNKLLTMLIVLVMILSITPITAAAADVPTVYISISDDAHYITDGDGAPIAYRGVPISALEEVDLAEHGLDGYVYDANGDGTNEITALHLYIYVHEEILGLDFSEVGISGSAGSIYFYSNLFGFSDENLRYDYNGAYPAIDGWGLTADQIVISDGDYFNIAHYTSWAFWGDSATGFHYFADENGGITYNYYAKTTEPCQVGIVRSYSDWMNGGIPAYAPEEGYTVCYGTSYGDVAGSVTTGSDGYAEIIFPSAGMWYVWIDGGYGLENPFDIVSAPAYAIVSVEKGLNIEAIDDVKAKITAIGTVGLESEEAIKAARNAYDALEDEEKALVVNYATLITAEKTLDTLKAEAEKAAADKVAADKVAELIAEIGQVTVFSASDINTARSAYNDLTTEQKELVSNIDILIAAEDTIKVLYEIAAGVDHSSIYSATGNYIYNLGTPSVGSVGGEWMVIGLVRSGYSCPDGYYENVVSYVNAKINDKEQLHRSKGTDNSRVILALTAAGYDVTNVGGHNLLMGLTDMTYVKKQGINGPIWALIAFDCYDYTIPVNSAASEQVTREGLIAYILEKQLSDGGWALSGKVADPDMTGMAIQALAPYYNSDTAVKAAVDAAIECLSIKQHDNGGFGSIDGVCTESCAQVIVALTALGIDPENDERFVKNGISVLDAMCMFAVEGGGFEHIPGGGLNGMATEQSYYALAAYYRFLSGQSSLYDMSDVVDDSDDTTEPAEPNEDGKLTIDQFTDVKTSLWYNDAINYVLEKGIMIGVSDSKFDPNGKLTRAMMWTMLARMKGIDTEGGAIWYDIAQKWAIDSKVSDGTDPNGEITREEMVTMLWRYAGEPTSNASLSKFSDGAKVSSWAKDATCWATENGIIQGKGYGILDPRGTATRAEVAQIFMNYFGK